MKFKMTREDWQRVGANMGWLKSASSDVYKCEEDLKKSIARAKANGDKEAERFLSGLMSRLGGNTDDLRDFIEMNREFRNLVPKSVSDFISDEQKGKPKA